MNAEKKKIVLLSIVAVLAIVAAVVVGVKTSSGPGETIATSSSHLGDKGYDMKSTKDERR